eukprot:scaffold64402_cov40-Phaeocystis_antarctica.AAC.2
MAPWLGVTMLTLGRRRRGGGRAHLRAAHPLLTTHTAYHTYCRQSTCGAWTDESTFVVTVLDASGSEVALRETNPNPNPNHIPSPNPNPKPNPDPNPYQVALGETVVMARHAPSTAAAAAHRPIRFKAHPNPSPYPNPNPNPNPSPSPNLRAGQQHLAGADG